MKKQVQPAQNVLLIRSFSDGHFVTAAPDAREIIHLKCGAIPDTIAPEVCRRHGKQCKRIKRCVMAKVFYNFPNYNTYPGVAPAGKITITERSPEEAQEVINKFTRENWRKMAREPLGKLHYPYLVPGATYNDLWDWDSFFTSCIIPEEGLPYAVGSCKNLIDAPLQNGRPTKKRLWRENMIIFCILTPCALNLPLSCMREVVLIKTGWQLIGKF